MNFLELVPHLSQGERELLVIAARKKGKLEEPLNVCDCARGVVVGLLDIDFAIQALRELKAEREVCDLIKKLEAYRDEQANQPPGRSLNASAPAEAA